MVVSLAPMHVRVAIHSSLLGDDQLLSLRYDRMSDSVWAKMVPHILEAGQGTTVVLVM